MRPRADSLAALAPCGQLVFFGEASGSPAPIHPDELYGRSLKVSSFWLAAEAAEAHRRLEQRETHGKLVLMPDTDSRMQSRVSGT
jgi:hypothetical protein